jgi:hypothetical protein
MYIHGTIRLKKSLLELLIRNHNTLNEIMSIGGLNTWKNLVLRFPDCHF